MVIAVEIRFTEAYQKFIYETFKRITKEHPQHSFIFIFDKPHDPSFIFSKSVTALVIKPQKISLLNDLTISSLLKKHKAEVFVTAQSLSQTKVPQCLIACDDLTSRSLKKAQVIVTQSEFLKKEIIGKYKIDSNKIEVVYKGVDEIFQPIGFREKEKIKEEHANGNEFFLAAGTIPSENIFFNLLKAFSGFKKMQKSNMHLLIACDVALNEGALEKLRLFKFKNDVKLLEKMPANELAAIMGAAYAFVYPFGKEYSPLLEAMKCEIPVVTNNGGSLPEICSTAALYVNADNYKDIADKMMQVFKDEKLRQQLIEKGREQVKKYSWDNAAISLWKCVEKACR